MYECVCVCVCVCAGDALGLEKGGVPLMCPLGCDGGKNALDYAFNHTDNHKCFMEQLLEKRRQLEERVTSMSPPHSTAHRKPPPLPPPLLHASTPLRETTAHC